MLYNKIHISQTNTLNYSPMSIQKKKKLTPIVNLLTLSILLTPCSVSAAVTISRGMHNMTNI